jgi:hypothetical protein
MNAIKVGTGFDASVADNSKAAILDVPSPVFNLAVNNPVNTVKTAEELGRPSANSAYSTSGFNSGEGGVAQLNERTLGHINRLNNSVNNIPQPVGEEELSTLLDNAVTKTAAITLPESPATVVVTEAVAVTEPVVASETAAAAEALAPTTPAVDPYAGIYRIGEFEDADGNRVIQQLEDIPMFAEGGIVNEPTLGVFGEAGPEAVVPLNERNVPEMGDGDAEEIRKLREEIKELRKTIADSDAYTQQILKVMIERNEERTDREVDAIKKSGKRRDSQDRN